MAYAMEHKLGNGRYVIAHYMDGFGMIPVLGRHVSGGSIGKEYLPESFQASCHAYTQWPVIGEEDRREFYAAHFPQRLQWEAELLEEAMSSACL